MGRVFLGFIVLVCLGWIIIPALMCAASVISIPVAIIAVLIIGKAITKRG
jgi:hypothetical protein